MMTNIQSFHKQQLLIEFAGLRQCAPDGVYLSLSPHHAMMWWGVMFMRQGPYVGVPLKFSITFPSTYPHSPPHVVFFRPPPHPLITPMEMKVSSPGPSSTTHSSFFPGSFSLKHGFPVWFSSESSQSGKKRNFPDSPELIWYIWSAFTESVLNLLPKSCAVDDHSWQLWNDDKDFFLEGLQAYKTEDETYRPWIVQGVNSDSIPIRFTKMDEEDVQELMREITEEQEIIEDSRSVFTMSSLRFGGF